MMPRTMRCPICKKPDEPPQPARRSYLPFCSQRCKLIDLGRWIDGKYQIPVHETERDLALDEPRGSDEDHD